MDENKLMEKFSEGVTKAAVQIGSLLVAFVFCAAATATDPFFRKNLGERYFSPLRRFLSAIAWLALIYASRSYSAYLTEYYHFRPSIRGTVVGVAIFVAYVVMARRNIKAMNRRRATGDLWHSRSKGESLFGSENVGRDLIIAIVISIALGWFSIFHSFFFILSRLMGYAADEMSQAALYNRYLDIVDGKIEAKFMETALREGFPPNKTGGLYGPLPDVFRGERRANIARIITGGPVVADPPDSMPTESQTPQRSNSGQDKTSTPVAAVSPQEATVKSAFQDAKNTTMETLASILRSKRFIRFAIIAVVLLAVGALGVYGFQFIRARMKPSPAIGATIPALPQKTIPASIAQTAAAPIVRTEVRRTVAVSNSPVPAESDFEAIRRQELERLTALEIQKQQEREKAAAQEQKRQEAERLALVEKQKRQEREKTVEQAQSTLTNQLTLLLEYKTNCEIRLATNALRIAKVAASSRKPLIMRNDEFRQHLVRNMQIEQSSLDNFQKDVQAVSSNPQLDPAPTRDRLTNYVAGMEGRHKAAMSMLDELSADISNAPPQRSLFNFNLK